jgi:hypothetical protein
VVSGAQARAARMSVLSHQPAKSNVDFALRCRGKTHHTTLLPLLTAALCYACPAGAVLCSTVVCIHSNARSIRAVMMMATVAAGCLVVVGADGSGR